jgi:hypothetical protein
MNINGKLAVLALSLATAYAQTPAPPTAPLPAQLATAHRLFLGNAGDQENADCLRFYNAFYDGVQAMKEFELVGTPAEADLVLELHYEFSLGGGVNSGSNTPRQFRVILIDPKTRVILWSITERTNYAVFQKNRDKNLDETIGVLLKDFSDITGPNAIPPHNRSTIHHNP